MRQHQRYPGSRTGVMKSKAPEPNEHLDGVALQYPSCRMERLFADLRRCCWCAGFAIQYSVSGDFEGLANNLRKPSLYLDISFPESSLSCFDTQHLSALSGFVTRRNSFSFRSVSSKFVSSDVILVDAGCEKCFADLRNHAWWSRNIENGAP